MFYFSYFLGEFYVFRSFNDWGKFEIVDVIPFYDVERIEKWCKSENLEFPYEINDCVNNLLSKIDLEWTDEYCVSSFCIHVANGDIKLNCNKVGM